MTERMKGFAMRNGLDRRDFLKLLGASTAAPIASCASKPVETIIPYVIQPEEITPGVATYYATVCQECPAGCGMLVRTREGRAVKVEGNPSHPVNQGALCARGQASLQGLYNPDRIRQPLHRNEAGDLVPISWAEAEKLLVKQLQMVREEGKADTISFVSGQLPDSVYSLVIKWLEELGSNRQITYEPFGYEALRKASQLCFSQSSLPTYDIAKARFLLSFGADFLETWLSPVGYAKAFGHMHSAANAQAAKQAGRFVQVEPRLSLTGANADEWIAIKPGREAFLALGMARLIVENSPTASISAPEYSVQEKEQLATLLKPYTPEHVAELTEISVETIRRLAQEFTRQSPSLAIGGGVAASSREETASLIAVHLLNYVAGNIGQTVHFNPPSSPTSQTNSYSALLALIQEMKRGEVPLLLLANTNPAFSLPPSAGFAAALAKVPFVVSFSSFLDETTEYAHLVLPDHTPLESWGDAFPAAGVHGLMQPVMQPVFETQALGDTLLSVAAQVDEQLSASLPWKSFFEYLQTSWQELYDKRGETIAFETFWQEALQAGGVWEQGESSPVQLSPAVFDTVFSEPAFDGSGSEALTFIAYPSSRYFDGRGANKPWLQELPDPMTQAVWDSWLEIHPETAARLGIAEGDRLSVTSPHGTVEAAAYFYDGLRRDSVAMPIGQGHTSYGRYAQGQGANPVNLLAAQPEKSSGGFSWLSTTVQLTRTGKRAPLVTTDGSRQQLGRGIAQVTDEHTEHLESHTEKHSVEHPVYDMYPALKYDTYRWGMSIDLAACIGCGACVTACYAENNIPVVGKDAVAQGREMSWLRIERYFEDPSGEERAPETRFAPMLCQHCGNAPCEPVCPVYATYHNPEGLNAQIYNRCVGTRYCANNCPYKVRRFNWFEADWPRPLHLQLNPDVTVREPGVMEKCTFCVQRIQGGKDHAKDEDRLVRDGEITPACAQTCPTQAITFGNLKDPDSRVSQNSQGSRTYKVFEELNTKPAITYLKKVRRRPK